MVYDKLKSYRDNKINGLGIFEIVASLLDAASSNIRSAKIAIQNNDIPKRAEESQKAITILSGLHDTLLKNSPQQKEASKVLEDYYKTMNDLIVRMNARNDAETGEAIEQGLKKFAKAWRDMGKEHLKSQGNSSPQDIVNASNPKPSNITFSV
ncbi:flagellar export chaperone FliS [Candidatus Nucleicultrix amoebiphila]|uniref:Flagellar secretion chaperone FliS n=1 Tax=Candidatus Nucleicultrix amoebiphila FS5 TaxID=1414854 RepID=A0A1W6N2M1_9PROT|nr:flagellar protein FliS [Candidatus Nucleicultrix amoebiphila]ARN84026.1 hypothetical protein GQ61_00155 [Candidatus Nucleicultrix amoebiphila FS5]